ncbi:MAG: hypothetical protein HY646_20720 [Acidobacteria bacterium]|nr:hypothetical protein [Acidobacteriota bacterium]
MNHRLRRLIGLVFAFAMMTLSLSATTVTRMDLPELVKTAETIVQGRVEQVYSQWDADLRVVFTYISINVDDPLKGERRRSVLIRQPGGKIGSFNMLVPGMPKFQTGDDVIVFLKSGMEGTYWVVGLSQGKYEIVDNYAVANVSGISIVDPKTGQMTDAGFVDKAPLEAFKAKIRELAR